MFPRFLYQNYTILSVRLCVVVVVVVVVSNPMAPKRRKYKDLHLTLNVPCSK